MKNLTEAGSTQAPAYVALLRLGYKVYREIDYESEYETWFAEKDDIRLSAGDILTLLGLHHVWEFRDETWQATEEQRVEFVTKFPRPDYSDEFKGGREIEIDDELPLQLYSDCEHISIRLVDGGVCEAHSKCKNPAIANIMMWSNDVSLCSEHLLAVRDLIAKLNEK